jgi:hypothetical protein
MKPIFQINIILFLFSILFSCTKNEETPFEIERFWVYGLMISCNSDPSSKLCYLISRTDTHEAAKWELLEYPIKGFELESGYFFHLEVKVTKVPGLKPSSPPITTYTLSKSISKIKDEAFKLNGEWKLFDLPQFEEIKLISEFPKFVYFIPHNRWLLTSYACNSGYLNVGNITEDKINFLGGPFTLKICFPDIDNYSETLEKEFFQRIFNSKKYELESDRWFLKDEFDNVLIVFLRNN